jgi:hypothetical protein
MRSHAISTSRPPLQQPRRFDLRRALRRHDARSRGAVLRVGQRDGLGRLAGPAHEAGAEGATAANDACSATRSTFAPAARAVAAAASSRGPLPAMTMRSPSTGSPP